MDDRDRSEIHGGPVAGPDHAHHKNPGVAHERRDVNIRGIIYFAVALVIVGAVLNLFLWWLLDYFETSQAKAEPPPPPMASQRQQFPPEPRLQGAPGHSDPPMIELRESRQRENQLLESYGWVDQKAGIVRIPIDQAKQLLLERGLPVAPGTNSGGAQSGAGYEEVPTGSSSGRVLERRQQ